MSGLSRWLRGVLGDGGDVTGTRLAEAIKRALPEADEDAQRLVVAVAGLLATVAYADRDYAPTEEARILQELSRVQGLDPQGVEAIRDVLRNHVLTVATVEAPVYARELRELADHDFRREVLDALVDIAAADDEITMTETNVLRATATALGLSQDDYNASQGRHRDKLRVLKK